jgi:hypothetical protein
MYLIQLRFPGPREVDWGQWSLVASAFCLQPISLRILEVVAFAST